MIAYFVKSGDPRVDEMFAPYIWGPSGIRTLLEPLGNKDYGDGLSLLLIEFFVEGKYPVFGPSQLRVRNYSTKNKDIAVEIPVTPSQFHEANEDQRREFLLKSTLDAIAAVQRRLQKRNFNIDFDSLQRDVELLGKVFVNPASN